MQKDWLAFTNWIHPLYQRSMQLLSNIEFYGDRGIDLAVRQRNKATEDRWVKIIGVCTCLGISRTQCYAINTFEVERSAYGRRAESLKEGWNTNVSGWACCDWPKIDPFGICCPPRQVMVWRWVNLVHHDVLKSLKALKTELSREDPVRLPVWSQGAVLRVDWRL